MVYKALDLLTLTYAESYLACLLLLSAAPISGLCVSQMYPALPYPQVIWSCCNVYLEPILNLLNP